MIALANPKYNDIPFPHFSSGYIINAGIDCELLNWFEHTRLWSLTETDFYSQYEFSLLEIELPERLKCLIEASSVDAIKTYFEHAFGVAGLVLVGITAHKLIDGHRMGVHNDFIGKDESHRLVIQINENWVQENGGFLMLFGSKNPQDVSKVVQPLHNSGIGFEISPNSYHAVSTVHNFKRYTLVYTFNKP
jgi:Rps23 Pro-64 3,4-dihydroxylase Tpa1-like proline 4-hydroxylase